ncbi:MAG: ion transporter [Saprospiraceae bacterium]|nr:ion transporter [Saprospiraceae bacterium]
MKDVFRKEDLKRKPEGFSPFRTRLHEIIFEAETKEGRIFDIVLLLMIVCSIIVLMLETVPSYYARFKDIFFVLEWAFTIFFTIEYFLRLYTVYSPRYYFSSFFGLVDLFSILPSYLTLLVPGLHSLMIIRALRLLRVFRIFKLDSFIDQGNLIINALMESRKKIMVFTIFILIMVCIFGCVMYLVERDVNENFDSIPRSMYWAIVTITTVGYGDISPSTPLGQFIATIIMLMGYVIIAVPTGIVTSSLMQNIKSRQNTISCPNCAKEGHGSEAKYCDRCGYLL